MTSQHDALYRAICEYPDEDTPRLAFADLLEEDGDPARAAFIRTRIELSLTRLDADDTTRLGNSAHAANLAELAFAQDGIDADGLRALVESPLFGRLASLELRENVIVAELLVDALGAAGGPGNLRKLSLAACRLTRHDAANLFALPVLRDLDHLDLSDNALHADGVAALAESNITRGLRTLNLSQTLPGVPGIQAPTEEKSRLARLRSLDL